MRIYLDHNATTPLLPEVVREMLSCLETTFGNPSSVHAEGREARKVLSVARSRVSQLFSVDLNKVIFMGSATEANNTVIAHMHESSAKELGFATTTIEHPSVEEPMALIEKSGRKLIRIGVDSSGFLDLDSLETALQGQVALLSVIWANNETGVIQPVAEISDLCARYGVMLHLDGTQAAGKIPMDLRSLQVGFVSVSAHKFNGPKGVGALIVDDPKTLRPWLQGGPQESRKRGGTENLAGIVGMGKAAEKAGGDLGERMKEYSRLRDELWVQIKENIPSVKRNGTVSSCLPNTLNVEFAETPGDVILEALDLEGISVSAGAACASGSVTPSHVLTAMGLSLEEARSSLRFSLGVGNDSDDVARAVAALVRVVSRIRGSRVS